MDVWNFFIVLLCHVDLWCWWCWWKENLFIASKYIFWWEFRVWRPSTWYLAIKFIAVDVFDVYFRPHLWITLKKWM
jgi:hypothetical protein